MAEVFYDDLAPVYDRMIRWERRLAFEAPLFTDLWVRTGATRVLDAACGSGAHLLMFKRQGLHVVGSDGSAAMLALAHDRLAAGLDDSERPPLVLSTWAELPERVEDTFDAVLCLGNSLPYLTDPELLRLSLAGLWSRVAPGGFLLLQFKNFARLRARRERFLPLSTWHDPATGAESLAIREYEWRERHVDFHVIVLERGGADAASPASTGLGASPALAGTAPAHALPTEATPTREWTMRHWSTPLATLTPESVAGPLRILGARPALHGSLALDPFDADSSDDVVIMATRERS